MSAIHVLYISYDGLCEPLGQSQVLRYILQLAKSNQFQFSIISFEKPADLQNAGLMNAVKEKVNAHGVQWYPFAYHKSPSLIATSYDVLIGCKEARRISKERPFQVIHARSYVAAFMAWLTAGKTRSKWIFDMRGFWADEKVDAKVWKRGPLYRLVKSLEKKFLANADHIISLTTTAVDEILSWSFSNSLERQKLSVIPTCVDLQLFRPKAVAPSAVLKIGYVGGVALWYDFQKAIDIFKAIAKQQAAKLYIINKSEHDLIRSYLKNETFDFELQSMSHDEVAGFMPDFDVGLFFIRPFYSKKASAPTKLAEFLACGVPVVTTDVGDVGRLLRDSGVAVILESGMSDNISASAAISLARNPQTRSLCREVAEKHFSLEKGTEELAKIYLRLSSQD